MSLSQSTTETGARLAVDVGGTFTDVVLARADGRLFVNKTTTTAEDPGEGVVAGIDQVLADAGLEPGSIVEIVHGTTIASNTILQKAGARTGLLTTAGFRDVLEIGRIRTPGMFDMAWRKPETLVARRWRLEVKERIAADGSVVTPLDENEVRATAARFQAEGLEAVAVCFISSYIAPQHEQQALRGAGRYRGGLGLRRSYRLLADKAMLQLRVDRRPAGTRSDVDRQRCLE
jgi:N-methylhydantoinase A